MFKELPPSISKDSVNNTEVVITDRVYEYTYLKLILERLFASAGSVRFKSDDPVINLTLLSLMLDFGLVQQFASLLNLPSVQSLQDTSRLDTKQLQVNLF